MKLVKSLEKLLSRLGIPLDFDCKLSSSSEGFEIFVWYFKLSPSKNFICIPSLKAYRTFLLRFKRIINNSNYGSEIKASKISPLIKEWNLYHRFSFLKGPKFSLFYLKKKCLKTFSKETKHDFYSSKKLMDKCFSKLDSSDIKNFESKIHSSPYSGHLVFLYLKQNTNTLFPFKDKNRYFCIHCGMGFYV